MCPQTNSPDAHRLTKTGESEEEAQQDRLVPREKRATVEELLEIAASISAGMERPSFDHADLLYDENGLPK